MKFVSDVFWICCFTINWWMRWAQGLFAYGQSTPLRRSTSVHGNKYLCKRTTLHGSVAEGRQSSSTSGPPAARLQLHFRGGRCGLREIFWKISLAQSLIQVVKDFAHRDNLGKFEKLEHKVNNFLRLSANLSSLKNIFVN